MSSLPKLINDWEEADNARLAANRAAADATHKAEVLKQQLITMLQSKELSAAGGKNVIVELVPKDVPTVSNWQDLYGYIQANQAWDLLQKRIGVKASLLRWADGIEIPGVMKTTLYNLSKRKVK